MNLQPEDYEKLREHFSAIEASARIGSQSNVSPWYVMDEIKRTRTGLTSDGMCGACVIDLYREFAGAIMLYEEQQEEKPFTSLRASRTLQ